QQGGKTEQEVLHRTLEASVLFELLQEPCSRLIFARLERLAPAGGVDGDGRQQGFELRRRAGIEATVGALGQTRDLAKGSLGALITSLLEQEYRHLSQRQFAGSAAQLIDVLFHAIADVDQGVDRSRRR